MIRSEGNGNATIVVSDNANQTKEIRVTCSNVAKYIYNPIPFDNRAYEEWRVTQGALRPAGGDRNLVHRSLLQTKYRSNFTARGFDAWGGPPASPDPQGQIYGITFISGEGSWLGTAWNPLAHLPGVAYLPPTVE
jgi:hypothetical protein